MDKEVTKKCKNCEKVLEKKGKDKRVRPNRKFCDRGCRTRYNWKSFYEENKDNEEYKNKNKNKSKKWYAKNREKHIKKVKENKK